MQGLRRELGEGWVDNGGMGYEMWKWVDGLGGGMVWMMTLPKGSPRAWHWDPPLEFSGGVRLWISLGNAPGECPEGSLGRTSGDRGCRNRNSRFRGPAGASKVVVQLLSSENQVLGQTRNLENLSCWLSESNYLLMMVYARITAGAGGRMGG